MNDGLILQNACLPFTVRKCESYCIIIIYSGFASTPCNILLMVHTCAANGKVKEWKQKEKEKQVVLAFSGQADEDILLSESVGR